MTRPKSIFTQVRTALQERSAAYGDPLPVLETTAAFWSSYLRQIITPRDVVILIIMMKLVHAPEIDDPEKIHNIMADVIGYCAIMDALEGYGKLPKPKGTGSINEFEGQDNDLDTDFLDTVKSTVTDRRDDYGEVEISHALIAKVWSLVLGRPLRPIDVDFLMMQYKIARVSDGPVRRDTMVDIAGYAALAARQVSNEINAVPLEELCKPEGDADDDDNDN